MTSTVSFASTTATSLPTSTETCIRVIPDKNGYVPQYACDANYQYYPSFAAALIFTVGFGIPFFIHVFQAFHYKKVKLCWALLMGAFWEFASFAFRTASTKKQQSVPLAFVSTILVLLAPMWINAFIYMVMGRMIYFFVPEQKIYGVKGTSIAKIFVWLDVLSFITQVAGGVMISPGSSQQTLQNGIHIYMGGVGFQEACILIFLSIATKFYLVVRNQERSLAGSENQILDGRPRNWRPLLWTLFAALGLITIRIIFRLVEFSAGITPDKNPIPFHEAYFMALDALPMLFAVIAFNVVHPGRILQGEGSEFPKGPSRREKKEAKRMKKEDRAAAKAEKNGSRVQYGEV